MAHETVVVVSPLRNSAHQNYERIRPFLPGHTALRVWTEHFTTAEEVLPVLLPECAHLPEFDRVVHENPCLRL